MELNKIESTAVAKGHMVIMESLRKFTLRTTKGHCIQFEARTPRLVPRAVVQDAMAVGCVPVNKEDTPFLEDESKAKVEYDKPLRRAVLFIALDALVKENETKNFDGGGNPKEEILEEMTGIVVQKKEIGRLMNEYRTCVATGSELPSHPEAEAVYCIVQAESKDELLQLAKAAGYPEDKAKGLVNKDLRRMLISKHVIASAG